MQCMAIYIDKVTKVKPLEQTLIAKCKSDNILLHPKTA